ncbi:MAG: hypothetical protein H5U19_10965 [Rhodobacteraceae bacterium]|jgi:hypothetical protein|nr:hypothetical protein [Paracoccaceae bacterium]
MELNRRPVASLWIGPRLHYINQMCLKSHLVQGHPVTLYCTDTVQNVPDGVTVRPASEIMQIDSAIVAETSASFVSNVFRYKMIAKTGAIWIDTDAYCHRPFPEGLDHIYGGHGMRGALNCGVVGMPQTGPLIEALLDYYDNLPDYPAWWGKRQHKKMDKLPASLPKAVRIYQTERTAFGPQAFTYYAEKTGHLEHAMSNDVLYPVPFQLNDVFYDPHSQVEKHFTDATLSVHIYTNASRPWWRKNPPLPGSYVARMCDQLDIDPKLALADD